MAPIVPLIIAGGIVGLIAFFSGDKKSAASSKKTGLNTAGLPAKAQELIKQADETGNTELLKEAAAIAAQAGNAQAAEAILKVYDGARVQDPSATFKSAISNVKNEYWSRFVKCVMGDNPGAITDSFALGLFGFGARRLVDLKVMKDPRQTQYGGRSVWAGTWIPPLSMAKFLADRALQYQLFFVSMRDYAHRITNTPVARALIGTTLEGHQISLSGMLGVMHVAGWSGGLKWFSSPGDRARFPATTAAFLKCNGIF